MKLRWIKVICILIGIILLTYFIISPDCIYFGTDIKNLDRGDSSALLSVSAESGYYSEPFELILKAPEGFDIFYTLDCSEPTRSSMKYEKGIVVEDASDKKNEWITKVKINPEVIWNGGQFEPPKFQIDKATIIRVALFKGKQQIGKVQTFTYFVGMKNMSVYSNLPIVSIICDEKSLFDEETGIYAIGNLAEQYPESLVSSNSMANYNLKGKIVERKSHVDYFDKGFQLSFSQDLGLRIRGGATRENAKKGFNLYARAEYGKPQIKNIFKPDSEDIEAFSLSIDDSDVQIKHALAYCLAGEYGLDTLECIPCNVFLNGEYWGFYYVCEKFDENYFKRYHNISEDNIIMVKRKLGKDTLELGNEDMCVSQELLNYVRTHDMSDDKVVSQFSEYIDMDDFLNYITFESYINNVDWPHNNYAMWRAKRKSANGKYQDGKWRFLLYDTDVNKCMYYDEVDSNPYELLMKDELIANLMRNPQFKDRLAAKMCDLTNMVFDIYHVEDRVENIGRSIAGSVALDKRQWERKEGIDIEEKIYDDTIQFFYYRPDYVLGYTKDALGQNEVKNLVIIQDNVESGEIQLNQHKVDLTYGSWEGRYFSGLTVNLKAIAKEGYVFKGWRILSEKQGNSFIDKADWNFEIPDDGLIIRAEYEKVS